MRSFLLGAESAMNARSSEREAVVGSRGALHYCAYAMLTLSNGLPRPPKVQNSRHEYGYHER